MFSILYVVFVIAFPIGKGVPHFPVYLFMGIIIWNFFTEMTSQSLSSIVNRGDLIRKIRIPKWIIVFSGSISALINLGLNLIVLAIFMVFNGVTLLPTIVLLPIILFEVYIFALGISLLLSAAFVKFRDLSYIWDVIIQAGFYLTPIIYPVSRINNELFQKLIFMNPLAQALQDARFSVISHDPAIMTISRVFDGGLFKIIPIVIVVVTLVAGIFYFRSQADNFAENL